MVRLLRGMLESSSTTIPASAAIKALISYVKIKLKSCRTADFCQNTSLGSSLNPKLATEGMLLQTTTTPPSQEVLVMCIAPIQTSFFQELFFLHIGTRGEQLNFDLVSKPSQGPKKKKKASIFDMKHGKNIVFRVSSKQPSNSCPMLRRLTLERHPKPPNILCRATSCSDSAYPTCCCTSDPLRSRAANKLIAGSLPWQDFKGMQP